MFVCVCMKYVCMLKVRAFICIFMTLSHVQLKESWRCSIHYIMKAVKEQDFSMHMRLCDNHVVAEKRKYLHNFMYYLRIYHFFVHTREFWMQIQILVKFSFTIYHRLSFTIHVIV